MNDDYGQGCGVPPLVSPFNPVAKFSGEPMYAPCAPCLPGCNMKLPYCPRHSSERMNEAPQPQRDHYHQGPHGQYPPPPQYQQQPQYGQPQSQCSNCAPPPVRTKYIMPCYRYEDGRIERYVPTRHSTLPKTVYARNGLQDQIFGYRGARRYVCACETPDGEILVHAIIEPLKKITGNTSQELNSSKKKKEKQYQPKNT